MKVGDRVKISGGPYQGKTGTIVSTRGSHVSNWVMVQLDRIVQGRPDTGLGHSSNRVGVTLANLTQER